MSDTKQVTPAAFITGHVTLQGIKSSAEAPNAEVTASHGEMRESVSTPASFKARPFLLVVPPGQCSVQATLGAVESEPVMLNLQDAETVRIDFVFGK